MLLTHLVSCGSGCLCIGDPPDAELTERQQTSLARYVVDRPPAQLHKLDIVFGEKLRLAGYTISPPAARCKAGSSVRLQLVWQVNTPLTGSWQLFTHLRDASGQIVANLDQQGPLRSMASIRGTPLPPRRWPKDKFIVDPLTFTIPKNAAPQLNIVAGLYRGRSRMPVTAPASARGDHAQVVQLAVKGARQAAIKQLNVPQLTKEDRIEIDGALKERAWKRAADTGPFVNVGTGKFDARATVQGRARLLWDERAMYVGFEVQDRSVTGGWPADAVDPHLWEKDTVEIMIDPDGDGDNRDYYEIQINPQNLVFDSQFDRYNLPRGGRNGPFGHQDWSAQLTSAVLVRGTLDDDSDRDRGYTVEARIPWSSFSKAKRSPPAPSDRWRMNLYAMQNNGGVAWSPILGKGNFHRASRFGRVKWVGRTAPKSPSTASTKTKAPSKTSAAPAK